MHQAARHSKPHKITFHGQAAASPRCSVLGLGVNRQSMNLISHHHSSATEVHLRTCQTWTDIVHVWLLYCRHFIVVVWWQLFEGYAAMCSSYLRFPAFQLAHFNVWTKDIVNTYNEICTQTSECIQHNTDRITGCLCLQLYVKLNYVCNMLEWSLSL